MKKLLVVIFICLVVSGGNARAEETACKSLEMYAELSMEIRQAGGKMSDAYKTLDDTEADASLKKILQTIIIGAYEQPRFATESFQQDAINDYANTVFLSCINGGK